jgi:hypothetical protein
MTGNHVLLDLQYESTRAAQQEFCHRVIVITRLNAATFSGQGANPYRR